MFFFYKTLFIIKKILEGLFLGILKDKKNVVDTANT